MRPRDLRGGASPSIIEPMQDGPLDPARHAQLAEALAKVFGPLDAAALADVESKLHWISLAGGDTLFRQGDRGDDVYVVVNGRVRAIADDPDGGMRALEESGRGSAIGELALLTGEPRAATIVAVRDSDLVWLPKAGFDELLHRHPQAMMQLARAAAVRLRRSSQRPARGGAAPITFALVPAGPGVPLTAFSLVDLVGLVSGDHLALSALASALREGGLDAVAEVPIAFRGRRVGRAKRTARVALGGVWKGPALRLRR